MNLRLSESDIREIENLLARFREDGDPRSREKAIEVAMPLAECLARRFEGRGEDPADLRQVAMVGLVHAADRFDASHGSGFVPYAVATVLGELKRHFRDRTWALRVPRSVKEQSLALRAAMERLEQRHAPATVANLAEETGLAPEQVLDALEGYQARLTVSLDAPVAGHDEDADPLIDAVSDPDESFETATDLAALAPALARLGPRDRRLLELRFVHEMSQSEIGQKLGVSQMQVSRMLRSLCGRLRAELEDA